MIGRERLGSGHIEDRADDPAPFERSQQRGRVDDRPARGVDEHRIGLHASECRIVEEPAGLAWAC